MLEEFIPKSYNHLRTYSFADFRKDLVAGLTVGIISLPLAMAFAIASGTSPERGLFTSIVAGFLISLLGGSRVQIGGPTGAFVVLIYDIIQRHGYEGLAISTLIASVLLVIFGLCRVGSLIKHVPESLTIGFTSGIAAIVFTAQIKEFFGLQTGQMPSSFVSKWQVLIHAFPTIHWQTTLLSFTLLLLAIFVRKWLTKIPWGIAAIVVGVALVYFFGIPAETIHTKFGQMPNQLPWPSLPSFAMVEERWGMLLVDGIAIAFLAGIESLVSAAIADKMVGCQHKPNCELVGQGIANFASVLFGGIPATGAIARTAANAKSGAQTPAAGMIHAVVILGIIWFIAPLAGRIPLAALSTVLIVISWNMAEVKVFARHMKSSFADGAILIVAFLLTIFVDIVAAVLGGMTLSLLFKGFKTEEALPTRDD